MWATSLTPVVPYFPGGPKPTKHRPLSHFPINYFSANSRLPPQPAASNGGNNPKQEEGKEISGSDVLSALQRAAAQKKTAKRKKRLASSEASHREKGSIDYSNVRPFEVNSEWSLKLDELVNRLQELEDTN